MSIPLPIKMCEHSIVNAMGHVVRPSGMPEGISHFSFFVGGLKLGLQAFAVAATAFSAAAVTTNTPTNTNAPATTAAVAAVTESAPPPAETAPTSTSSARGFDESAFRIVVDRNIFNANRSGGQVRLSSSRRPTRVESFTLVGTIAYEKGAFAFFNGSSSEFSKVVKSGGVIAGYKVADVLANAVKLEGDGKVLDLPIGSAMRREDEGAWHLGEGMAGSGGSTYASTRENDPSGRSGRAESASGSSTATSNSSADQSEILKRLMERRAKESQ